MASTPDQCGSPWGPAIAARGEMVCGRCTARPYRGQVITEVKKRKGVKLDLELDASDWKEVMTHEWEGREMG